jgi:hypothetical protein
MFTTILLESLQSVAGFGDGGEPGVEPAIAPLQTANSAFALVVNFLILSGSHANDLNYNAARRCCKPFQTVKVAQSSRDSKLTRILL